MSISFSETMPSSKNTFIFGCLYCQHERTTSFFFFKYCGPFVETEILFEVFHLTGDLSTSAIFTITEGRVPEGVLAVPGSWNLASVEFANLGSYLMIGHTLVV